MSVKQRVKLNAPKPTKKKMTDAEILAALRECLYALLFPVFPCIAVGPLTNFSTKRPLMFRMLIHRDIF